MPEALIGVAYTRTPGPPAAAAGISELPYAPRQATAVWLCRVAALAFSDVRRSLPVAALSATVLADLITTRLTTSVSLTWIVLPDRNVGTAPANTYLPGGTRSVPPLPKNS